MKPAFLCAALLVLPGCVTTQGRPAGATFCDTAAPIYWNKNDTRRTKEQVDTHNRIGKALCGWGRK